MDGAAWFCLRRHAKVVHVESNAGYDELSRLFSLELNASVIVKEIATAGPELEPYLAATRGLRVLRYADPVECVFTFLCTANNHVARIATMVRQLASYGPRLDDHPTHRRFPTLECLAALSETDLRSAGFGYRGASMPKVAVQLLHRGGARYVEDLRGSSFAVARAELMSLPSIGPKLADCIALFGLGFRVSVPVDTHLWKAATRLYFPDYAGTALTQQKYEEFASFFSNRFGPNAGWAHQALFFDSLVNWRSRKNRPNASACPGSACE